MLTTIISLSSLGIAIYDLRLHLIKDRAVLLYAVFLALDPHPTRPGVIAIILLGALLLTLVFNFGGGDFKLFTALTLTQGALVVSRGYLLGTVLVLSISLVIHLLKRGSLQGSLACAPALLLPFLVLYLDI